MALHQGKVKRTRRIVAPITPPQKDDKGMKRIEGDVPFGDMLALWLEELQFRRGASISQVSHRFDRPYLAWESVRLVRNPYFEKGTGLEGYWIGQATSSEEVFDGLLHIGRDVLNSQVHLYRYQPNFRRRLMRALRGESIDFKVLTEWSVVLGAMLGRLRCNVHRNPVADTFRRETYRQVEGLPLIQYQEVGNDLRQVYELRDGEHPDGQRLYVDPNLLSTTDLEAWQIAASIGKFGHPLVRELLVSKPR